MFCSQCGAVATPGAQFCTSCGAAGPPRNEPVSPPAIEGSTAQPAVASEIQFTNAAVFGVQPPPAKNRKGKVIAIIGAAVVVLIIIIVVAGSGGNTPSSGGNPSGVNTNSTSYHDGYRDGQDTVINGSGYSVQNQCEDYYETWQNISKAEYMAGCLAGASDSGNSGNS